MTRVRQVNMHEAKTHLSRLVDEVAAGAEIVIAKAGKPAARLMPLKSASHARKPGYLKGRIKVDPRFDAPLPESLLKAFEGRR